MNYLLEINLFKIFSSILLIINYLGVLFFFV